MTNSEDNSNGNYGSGKLDLNCSENLQTEKEKQENEAYEAQAREQIEAWMNPSTNILTDMLSTISSPIDKAGDALMNSPQFGDTLKDAVEQTLIKLNEGVNWTIDRQSVLDAYKHHTDGTMTTIDDIQKLPLSTLDSQVKFLKSKYVAATSAQGVTTGVVGWAGIPVDIVALISANLRAISQYASYYGFDMDEEGEQLFAMSLLSIATSHSAEQRQAALDETMALLINPETMAFNKINEELMARLMRQTATQVATNLVKTKAAQIVPAVGSLVAGGVNAHYTNQVCEAAYQCYRKRFLDRKYG